MCINISIDSSIYMLRIMPRLHTHTYKHGAACHLSYRDIYMRTFFSVFHVKYKKTNCDFALFHKKVNFGKVSADRQ